MLVGTLLRVHKIGDKGLWMDEILSLCNAVPVIEYPALPKGVILAPKPIIAEDNSTNSFRWLWFARSWEPYPPFYFMVLKIWISWFGSNDGRLRSLSAIFSVLMIPLGFFIGRYFADRQGGLLMAGLLAISPISIYYAQEVRGYTLLTLFVLTSFCCLLQMERKPKSLYRLAYALSLALALYTHYLAFWIILAHAAYVAWQRDRVFLLDWLKGVVMAGILFLPWLPQFFAQRTVLKSHEFILTAQSPWTHFLSAVILPFRLVFSKDLFSMRPISEFQLGI